MSEQDRGGLKFEDGRIFSKQSAEDFGSISAEVFGACR